MVSKMRIKTRKAAVQLGETLLHRYRPTEGEQQKPGPVTRGMGLPPEGSSSMSAIQNRSSIPRRRTTAFDRFVELLLWSESVVLYQLIHQKKERQTSVWYPDEKITYLIDMMRLNLELKTRSWRLVKYKDCFTGIPPESK